LIHVAGPIKQAPELQDSELGLAVVGTVLERTVEMYQWKETEHSRTVKVGGGQERVEKEWTYAKQWSSHPISSTRFHDHRYDQNPPADRWPLRSHRQVAAGVQLGMHPLNRRQVEGVSNPVSHVPCSSPGSHVPCSSPDPPPPPAVRLLVGHTGAD
jgi:hypothetical protein